MIPLKKIGKMNLPYQGDLGSSRLEKIYIPFLKKQKKKKKK